MKIEQHKELETRDIAGNFETTEASIDKSSEGFLFEMMSKNLYSNAIGSIVREITSNCFDSHKEANVDDAIVIDYNYDEEGNFIIFKDFGVGLSPERMKNIYMKYFSSTKRDTNDQIGGFGLGSKTPLAYTDYFYIITNFNSIKYGYVFSKGEQRPTLDLLSEEETEERNGTQIKIYLKNDSDYSKFEEELKLQLSYFDNVYFQNWDIDNEYRIYEANTFKYRNTQQYSDEMHIVLGKVAYPISWKELDLNRVKIPVGVKFEIGELQVTPSREAIRYTDESKELVKQRIEDACKELISMYREGTMVYDKWFDYLDNKDKRPYIVLNKEEEVDEAERNGVVLPKEERIYLTGLRESKAVFKLFHDLGMESNDYSLPELFNYIYESAGVIDSVEKIKPHSTRQSIYQRYYNNNSILLSKDKNFTNIRNLAFLNQEVFIKKKLDKYFIRKIGEFVVRGYEASNPDRPSERDKSFKYFNLGLAMKAYKIYKYVQNEVAELIDDYNRPLTPEDEAKYKQYLREKNKINIERKELGKFPVKDIVAHIYGNDEKYDMNIADIRNFKGIVIYGFLEDEQKLRKLTYELHRLNSLKVKELYKNSEYVSKIKRSRYDNFDYNSLNPLAIKVLRIAKNNEKHFKNPNMVYIDNFKTNHRIFRKMASVYKIENFFTEFFKFQSRYSNSDIVEEIMKINDVVGTHLSDLFTYSQEFRVILPSTRTNIGEFKEFRKEVLEIAEANNWFDESVIFKLNIVQEWFKGVEILKLVDIKEDNLPIILKYLYENKKKLNYEYYAKYCKPELFEGQLIIDFEPKEEENEAKIFKIIKEVA